MKKLSILFAILLIATTLLTGCNSGNENAEQTSTENPKTGELKTFNDVYSTEGLEKSVYYLNDNFDSFSEESKSVYMHSLSQKISERANSYYYCIILSPVDEVASRIIENVNSLYQGIYNSDTNAIYTSNLNEEAKTAAQNIKDDNFFTLCKKYYAMNGNIEDLGFDIIVRKEIYDILMDRYANDAEVLHYSFEFVKSYTHQLSATDTKFESEETYPIVLVENANNIEMLRNEWKVEILLPVNIEQKPAEVDVHTSKEDAASLESSTNSEKPSQDEVKKDDTDSETILTSEFDALPIETRMERLLDDVNRYTWNMDDQETVKKYFVSNIFMIHGYAGDLKEYINQTYIYEIPSSYGFEVNENEYDGDAYAFVYKSIFGEEISVEKTMIIDPSDPPLINTILVSYKEIEPNKYEVIGAYGGTGRIKVTVDYTKSCMVIKSIERYEEKGSIGKFVIQEVDELPSGEINLMEITNPAYENEPESNLTTYIFTIEGKYDFIGVTTQKSLDSEKEEYVLSFEGEDIVFEYNTMFPTDFSQDTLLIRSSGGNEYNMRLNDAVERDLYFFEE